MTPSAPASPHDALPATTDVCVVGGGVYGLVLAYHLARTGVDVTVLERGRPGGEASSANAGSIGVQNKPLAMQAATLRAAGEWSTLAAELDADVGYERIGGMRIGTAEADVERLRRELPAQQAIGVPVEFVEGDTLRREAPYLGDAVVGATYCPIDGLSNPLATNRAYLAAARRHGARLVRGAGVVAIEGAQDGFRVETTLGPLACARVVNAAGAWSSSVAAMLGLALPTTWALNLVTITEPHDAFLSHLVTHVRGNLTVKQHHGRVLVGGAWRGEGDPYGGDKRVHLENLRGNLAWAARAIPGLRRLHVLRTWAGVQGHSPDRTFVAGPHAERAGAWVFTAGSGGYTLAPYVGKLVAEWMTAGRRPDDLAPMDVARFEAAAAPGDGPVARNASGSRSRHPQEAR